LNTNAGQRVIPSREDGEESAADSELIVLQQGIPRPSSAASRLRRLGMTPVREI